MFAIKCPRCTKEWYSNEKAGGRVRLCTDCIDALKQKQRHPLKLGAFLIVTAALVLVDLLVIPLAGLMPGVFGKALFGYGWVLTVGGMIVGFAFYRVFRWGSFLRGEGFGEIDWSLMRWPLVTGLAGLACVLAYYSLGIPAWVEQHPPEAKVGPPMKPPAPQVPPSTVANPPLRVPSATDLPGLLGHWSFDDESVAPKVADQSGKGNHATPRGVTWTTGVRGKALAFNGTDAYLDYGNSPDFNFPANAPFSLACWVKTQAPSGVICGQRSSTDDGADGALTVEQRMPCATVRQDRAQEPARVIGSRPLSDGAWHHLVLTRDERSRIERFLDGTSQGQALLPESGPITTDLRCLGVEPRWARERQPNFGGVRTYLEGAIDEFCIFNRKLSSEEIRTLAGR